MFHSIDIDLYKEGFEIKNFDCIDAPFAAAAGAYDYNNYFYYGFLRVMDDNFGNGILDKNYNMNAERMVSAENAYNYLGLEIKKIETHTKEQTFEAMRDSIIRKHPILIMTYYNSLYYHRYYMDTVGPGAEKHALVIDAFNDTTNVFRIRDSSFLRGQEISESKADILFPLRVTWDMIWDIMENTHAYDPHLPRIMYEIKPMEDEVPITLQGIFEKSMMSIQNNNSLFLKLIDVLDIFKDKIKDNDEFFVRHLCGGFECMFMNIEKFIYPDMDRNFQEEYIQFKTTFMDSRVAIFNRIYASIIMNKTITSRQLESFKNRIIKNETELRQFLEKCHQFIKTNMAGMQIEIIDLKKYFNNKGFTINLKNDKNASLTENGIAYLWDGVIKDKIGDTSINIVEDMNGNDNISCNGQHLYCEKKPYDKLIIYACSEYGSYEKELKFYLDEEAIAAYDFKVSDFYEIPLFEEKIVWSGKAIEKKNKEEYGYLDFSSKIFKYVYQFDHLIFDEIELPNQRNIHIFRIAMCTK